MKQIKGDIHLISESFLKDVLRQPPLDPDRWFKQKGNTPLDGLILISIEELRELWHMGYNNGYTTCHMGIEPDFDAFATYLQSKGINHEPNNK